MEMRSKSRIKDVARVAGVSLSTVSLVMNNHAKISPATTLKVKEAAKLTGYDPGPSTSRRGHRAKRRRPSTYRKMQVALISQIRPMLLETPVYSKVMRGIESELSQQFYNLIIRNLPAEESWNAIPHKIDGAILFAVREEHPKLLKELRKIPCVRIMGSSAKNEFFDYVTYNNKNTGILAAEHLLAKDHRVLAYMGMKNDLGYAFRDRRLTFISTVEKTGAKAFEILADDFLDESRNTQLPNVKAIGNAIEQMKRLPEMPTAIFAPADTIVIGLYHALPHYGIVPGKDIEIIGVNNDSILLNHFIPRPASVDIHPEAVGRKAVEHLLWRIENPKEPLEEIEIEPEIAFI